MRIATAALLVVALVAGCSGTPAPTSAPTTAQTTAPTAAATSVPTSTAAVTRVEVTVTDSLRMEPAEMRVPAGVPVTFVVTNTGVLPHEFYLGDEDAQAEHEEEMAAMPGMTHDEPDGIGLDPGETKELTYTFEAAGVVLAGCHVPGHYGAGMKAVITVE